MDANFTCKYEQTLNFFVEDLDGFRCALATMSLILYNINFGYICAILLLLIAIISLFGGIKADYRWFILNQIIWDGLLTYKFIWFNYIKLWFYRENTCYSNEILCNLFEGVPYASYSALLLLSFSRFLCLYLPNFYKKLTKNHRIFITIFIYNFIIVSTSLYTVFFTLTYNRIFNVLCTQKTNFDEFQECLLNPPHDFTSKMLNVTTKIQIITSTAKPPLCLFLSIFSTIMMIFKISQKFRFQSKNNTKNFYISLRILLVISFQTLMYSFIFILEGFHTILRILRELQILKSYPELAKWWQGSFSLTDTPTINCFIQIRIFMESIIVLFIMSGYREAIANFGKYILLFCGLKFDESSGDTMVQV